MGGEVTLRDALGTHVPNYNKRAALTKTEQVEAHGVKERGEGLQNLKYVLRQNQQSPNIENLGDVSYHRIYEILFRVAVSEHTVWLNAKTATTRSAADTRLSNTASALRLAVEVGTRMVRLKTIKALLDHVSQSLPLASGGLCTPLALDYAKCLRTALSHQPHVEHLPQKDWERTAVFCIETIKMTEHEMADDDAMSGAELNSTAGTTNGTSYRSSRSHYKESAGSQTMRSLVKQVTEELIGSLCLLTAAPNARIGSRASDLLWSLIDFLKANAVAGRSHQEAFAAINHVLARISTENITLTQKATSHLIRLIRHFWPQKSTMLKDEMLVTLLYLRPFVTHLMRQEEALTLRTELSGLLDVLRTEYGKRAEREILHLDDLRLAIHYADSAGEPGSIHTVIFGLRCAGARAEANWTLVSMLATLCSLLGAGARELASSDEDEDVVDARPRKRQRLSNDYQDTVSATGKGSASSRACALQTITFLAQQHNIPAKQLGMTMEKLSAGCGEDNGTTASWALLALASCASQASAAMPALATKWNAVWQVASRAISNTSTCRAACHLLGLLIELQLVASGNVSELVQTFTTSMDLNGPSILADSVLHVFRIALRRAHQLSPGTVNVLAEGLLTFFCRMFRPSSFVEKTYVANQYLYEPSDVLAFLNACLNHQGHTFAAEPFPTWDTVAQIWLACEEQSELVAYLLLLPKPECPVSQDLLRHEVSWNATASAARVSCETVALNHLVAELHKTQETWSQWSRERPRTISMEMFRCLCNACCVLCCMLQCRTFRDTRRQTQAQRHLAELLDSLSKFAAGSNCGQDKVDCMLSAFSRTFTGATGSESSGLFTPSKCEKLICRHLTVALSTRQQTRDFNGDDDDEDRMDMDDMYDSQDSRRGRSTAETHELRTDHSTAFSVLASRSSVDLYAALVTNLEEDLQAHRTQADTASSRIVDHILSLPEANIICSRRILSAMPQLGLLLQPDDADRLLDKCTENILQAYQYERSEVAIGAILELMSSLIPVWTNPGNKSLHGLGLDMYEWCMHALSEKAISSNVQQRVATLLLQICQVDADYGRDSGVQSVRTSLFQLLKDGSIMALHHLAGRISAIFGLFVLSKHQDIFDDLQTSLPEDTDWIEGMAIRLLFIAKLASAWHSLLRQCVYYIFETAGHVKRSAQHAAHCIGNLTKCLGFDSAQKLFRLFAPQLLYSWLEENTLTGLPYAAFQYTSLEELLERNQVEITAQLLMRGREDSMHVITKALKLTGKELCKRAFAKSLAYAISWDISSKPTDSNDAGCEARLRNLVVGGSKEDFRKMIQGHFPTIMGQFYLSAQQEDDVKEKWLVRKGDYSAAAKALSETKSYSQSTRTLPPSQQPSFKPKILPDQIERLCRRTGHDPTKPWDASSFTLAARMQFDAIDDALGPLHKCVMLRKLRTLICLAGDVALSGFPMEMLVHSIGPFLSDSECADDALGILHYLLHRGQSYLKHENVQVAYGTVLTMILRMQEHSVGRQDSTTQESQHRLTVQKMEGFQAWLVKYLQQCQTPSDKQHAAAHSTLVKALNSVRLPGNAHKESPESFLLMVLLEQQLKDDPAVPLAHCIEGLRLLTRDFEAPNSTFDDCLGSDDASARCVDSLWHVMKTSTVDDGFLLWASTVLGRGYVSTGVRPNFTKRSKVTKFEPGAKHSGGVAKSQLQIARCLSDLVQSPRRAEAGLADWTLRNALLTFGDAGEALAFEQMLPHTLVLTLIDGTFGYEPPLVTESTHEPVDRQALRHALGLSSKLSDEAWFKRLAVTLCLWASQVPILSALPALLHTIPELAIELLPSIVHIVLAGEVDRESVLRAELSDSMSVHLAERDSFFQSRQQLLLEVLMYLRGQPLPGENTQADRTRWLEVDLLLAADAAARCEMPTFALLLAESVQPVVQSSRRTSSRVSMSQLTPVQVPDDLLISIFKQIDEPDSFYGVQQSASLDSVLERLDYEGNGLKSLMFRSAQMDSAMRLARGTNPSDSRGMMHSLSVLSLHSLEYALQSSPLADAAGNTDEMLDTARKLQQWDLASPDERTGGRAATFAALQELSRTSDICSMAGKLRTLLLGHARVELRDGSGASPSAPWCSVLATLTEIGETLNSASDKLLQTCWRGMQSRGAWMRMARYEDCDPIVSSRSTLFSVLARNSSMLQAMHIESKLSRSIEAESLLLVTQSAREHGMLQEALSAATQVSMLATQCKELGLDITAATRMETALVMWDANETSTSVSMLRDLLRAGDTESQAIPVGESGLLAQLAYQLGNARLEKPDEILENCLKPAIKHLRGRTEGHEAGKVFHEFAVFCDQQMQNPSNLEDFNRVAKLRQKQGEELRELKSIAKSSKKSNHERGEASKQAVKAQSWYDLDDAEYSRLTQSRDTFLQQCLQNYLLALHASDQHDICVLRFFTMWLDNADAPAANTVVSKSLPGVPSWKFAVLNNQLMSRLESARSSFQESLRALIERICAEHPYHSLHHLFAATRPPNRRDDVAAMSRFKAAQGIRNSLQSNKDKGDLVKRTFAADNLYNDFASSGVEGVNTKSAVKDFPPAVAVTHGIVRHQVPPATISLPLRPDGKYPDIPIIVGWGSHMDIMSGNSHPKVLTAKGSDGVSYKQLFKHNDDLRQDAIMEQVFEEVSKLLRNHKAARLRNLQVRTYKVVPLAAMSGILEWVPNSIPIGAWLSPAHMRYYPQSLTHSKASAAIRAAQNLSNETKIKEFRKVCEQIPPVMRHFFSEKFSDPDEWFHKRTAYTRTTATVSILGYVLGLGDRHLQNIMLDEKSGEAVHIDLGIAFEAGRVLPVPENVPFRLSRDIVDAMGVTKTEGVFRRCCEFTMDALREDKDSIMTLLNVLRYDPLYNWTVSPLRAKRMQDAQETGRNGGADGEEASSKKKEQEAGEADRALSIVEKKLSKTLSTAATVNELIQQATDEKNLATLFAGWSAFF
ncbi:hypothetical protein LTR36_009943 [Oleoguttula mirabilis]|uniref:Serine/threonine-protein kinase Tel1 n=1 Tax=Oleoguttula mirabilis TaxID=1507867 RepID=A0AAV9J6F8_9PEZI|nr:hypothetical protein LTR36_009943 [Oleoguttula mirabilis]